MPREHGLVATAELSIDYTTVVNKVFLKIKAEFSGSGFVELLDWVYLDLIVDRNNLELEFDVLGSSGLLDSHSELNSFFWGFEFDDWTVQIEHMDGSFEFAIGNSS